MYMYMYIHTFIHNSSRCHSAFSSEGRVRALAGGEVEPREAEAGVQGFQG